MTPTMLSAPPEPPSARNSVIVEYRTVHLEPRVVFDGLTRTAFEACEALADALFAELSNEGPEQPAAHVRCGLEPERPGTYLLSFEIPPCPQSHEHRSGLSRLLLGSRRACLQGPDPFLQGELQSATQIIEDLLLLVDAICSTTPGRLSLSDGGGAAEGVVEIVDGIRVLQRAHRRSWELLARPGVQELLRGVLAPFRNPEIYTMNVEEFRDLGSLGSNWTLTVSEQLSRFADGGRLELPEPARPRAAGGAG
ncbi:hypothetical protein [Kocuria palustris]|uniref:hypothetical protein n=1 Tax=Kocuria palustris TaxID=71999 RepID=UPI0011A2990E|nr:hypothetical protein [Kocuria palustris]